MEQTTLKKKRGRPAKKAVAAAPVEIPTLAVEEVKETAPAVQTQYVAKRGALTDIERSDPNIQIQGMQMLAGEILMHFKDAIKKKQLGFVEELKLFHEIAPYLGYTTGGNKLPADVGLETQARKFVEINQRVRVVEQRLVSKS